MRSCSRWRACCGPEASSSCANTTCATRACVPAGFVDTRERPDTDESGESDGMERPTDYEPDLDTDEPDRRLELLHDNVRKYGTVFNTVSPGTQLNGVLQRR